MASSTIKTTIDLPKSLPWLVNIKPDELGIYIRKSLAVELFREGRVSLGKAAEIAGFETKMDMIDELMIRNIGLDYSMEDAEEDLNALKQILK
ncbi:MAG TPA: UPF0175 family protein [Methanospirillum sp.]|uniref:UPF0175 family protein n=1 Tax=Methanospirillum sp. TaxID=45200 RepID=UPI002B628B17|nr:UPF0175 family protein [Methanospirillum sp.]HOJ97371.1 UPF0175 family protein [Methanospirillum sp.]HPP77519.1 UPF0175 family protein [Methanospirillum sp.]